MARKIDYDAMANELFEEWKSREGECLQELMKTVKLPGKVTKEMFIESKGVEYETVCPYCGKTNTGSSYRYVPSNHTCLCGKEYNTSNYVREKYLCFFRKGDATVFVLAQMQGEATFETDGKFNSIDTSDNHVYNMVHIPDVGTITKWEIYHSENEVSFRKHNKSLTRSSFSYWVDANIALDNITSVRGVQIPTQSTNHALYDFLNDIENATKKAVTQSRPTGTTAFDIPEVELKDITKFLISVNSVEKITGELKCQAWCECGNIWEASYFRETKNDGPDVYQITCPQCGKVHTVQSYSVTDRYRTESHTAVHVLDNDNLNSWDGVMVTYVLDNEWNIEARPSYAFRIDKATKKVSRYLLSGTEWKKTQKQCRYQGTDLLFLPDSLKYSGLRELFNTVSDRKHYSFSCIKCFSEYIAKWAECPVLEQGVKRNPKLADAIIGYFGYYNDDAPFAMNFEAKNTAELFCLSERLMKYYCKSDEYMNISTIQRLYKVDNNVTEDALDWIRKNSVNDTAVIRLFNYGIPIAEITAYLERVRKVQYVEPYAAIGEWADYLSACDDIGTDLNDKTVKYPRHLLSEHNIVINKRKLIADANKDEAFKKRCDKYAKLFNYKDKNIIVKAPESIQELLEEGRKLHHCVGSYADRIIEGESLIFFIRKTSEPDKPWLTINVDELGKVLELRGNLDRMATPSEKKLLKDWVDKKNITGGHWL